MGKLFNFFSGSENRHDKGVTKKQVQRDQKMGGGFFFRLLKNRFGTVSATSLIFSLCNFPLLLFLFVGLAGVLDDSVPSPASPLYAQLYGLEQAGESGPLMAVLRGMFGLNASATVVTTATKVFLYSAVLLILTLGLATIGAVYVSRSMVRLEPISVWSEFFSSIRRNFKQGLPIAILDALVIFFLCYDLMAYYTNAAMTGNMMTLMMFYVVLFFSCIYYVMRFHIYLILVTFDLKFTKLLKNALYLVFLGWKRSIVCAASSAAVLFVSLYLYRIMPYFGLLLPFALTFGLLHFIGVYCTYPIIDRYMIEPYYRDHPEERPQEEEVEAIFEDHG